MTLEEAIKKTDEAYGLMVQASRLMTDAVMNGFLFTWQWWAGVSLAVIPWMLWFFFRKKESSDRLLYAGFLVMLLASVMDLLGTSSGRWTYPMKILPTTAIFLPYQFTVIPVSAMFFLQIKPNLNPFLKAIVFAGLGAYIGLPLLAMYNFYNPKNWAYTYSFFILMGIYLVAHWFSRMNNFERIELNDPKKSNRKLDFNVLRRKEKIR
ncbi:CBO0543 family protein [Ammoniphilus sp. YIM 78166]|uniref:CBO0543 family protein n=1 Tax=Ammoniphilus sp. YIM 78166 TaxID=1644106 RepID=UPI00106FC4B2|nr:CBO0543 family protein [Ammoniphilus sp. YIM 78166]